MLFSTRDGDLGITEQSNLRDRTDGLERSTSKNKMVRVGEESDLYKSQLVAEICSISSNAHHCRVHSTIKTPFMDWYLLLRVDDNARSDVIRKQYRKLALQLHPDKNRHPKAEIAFKLVSEDCIHGSHFNKKNLIAGLCMPI
ncbi:hypothetical protein IFM89_036073 [Coptis chinensis]|uniref:J domain-containing protein n=1 Tax=Coptis chinensis TaxID=261450 RepID=A0A835HZ82_9MAGN|nr:hypothetical protein IFM89_036073 [Coptis chinensis]